MAEKFTLFLVFMGKKHEFPIVEGINAGLVEKMGEILGNNPPYFFRIEITDSNEIGRAHV